MRTDRSKTAIIPLWIENLVSILFLITILTSFTDYILLRVRAQKLAILATVPVFVAPDSLAVNPYSGLKLEAKAAIVYDVRSGKKIYSYNEQAQLPLASLTKLMTALVAFEKAPEYTIITVSASTTEQDSKLRSGDRWMLRDLVDYTLLSSSNYGADSIASVVGALEKGLGTVGDSTGEHVRSFVESMNAKATLLGLNQTYFLNSTGLDSDTQMSGAYGSAADIASLLSYIVSNRPMIMEATKFAARNFTSLDNNKFQAKNTNIITDRIPGLMASKTGFTDLAGGNLAVVFDVSAGEPFVIVILGSSEQGRFRDMTQLVDATIDYLGTRYQNMAIAAKPNRTLAKPCTDDITENSNSPNIPTVPCHDITDSSL